MAINFKVATLQVPDNKSYVTADSGSIASLIEAWLDGLSITTVYSLNIEHHAGFWVCIVAYA